MPTIAYITLKIKAVLGLQHILNHPNVGYANFLSRARAGGAGLAGQGRAIRLLSQHWFAD